MTARKSASLKNLQGTARADRTLKATGSTRLTVAPRPPARLSPTAAQEWRTLATRFVVAGVLAETDLRALEMLCEALADESAARLTLAAEGMTIPGHAGAVKVHPAVRAGQIARQLAARLLAEFGSTPAARQRVEQAPGAPVEVDQSWERLRVLQGGGKY